MATVQQEQQQRRRDRKHLPLCPGCGNTKSPSYVFCTACRAKRSRWQEIPIRPRFPRSLPVAPLLASVEEWLRFNTPRDIWGKVQMEEAVSRIGINTRRWHEWRTGDAFMVGVGLADRILTAIDRDWLDVWTREEHPRFAACLDAIDALGEAPADGWCPVCCEPVASVNGTCPWHPVPVVVEPYLESEAA